MAITRSMLRNSEQDSSNGTQCNERFAYHHVPRASTASIPPTEKPFPFLLLPAEIRNQIYELLLLIGLRWQIHSDFYMLDKDGNLEERVCVDYIDNKEDARPCTQLFIVNKQVYNEAIGLLYSNHFSFCTARDLAGFLTRINPRHLKFIKEITLYVYACTEEDRRFYAEYLFDTVYKDWRLSDTEPLPAPLHLALSRNLPACESLSRLRLQIFHKGDIHDFGNTYTNLIVGFLVDLVEICTESSPLDGAEWVRQHGGLGLFEIAVQIWDEADLADAFYSEGVGPDRSETGNLYANVSAETKMEIDCKMGRLLKL